MPIAFLFAGTLIFIYRRVIHKSVSKQSLRFPCEFCGIVKDRPESLKRHIRKFHTEADNKVACTVCNKVFHQMDLAVSPSFLRLSFRIGHHF